MRLFIDTSSDYLTPPPRPLRPSISLPVGNHLPPRPQVCSPPTKPKISAMPHTTPTYPAQFVFIGTALRGERAPKCLKHFFRLNTLPFDAKSPWRIPYDELPPLVSGISSLRWQKWKEPGPGEGVNASILPSARFLLSGEETRSARSAKCNTDVI